MGKIKNFFHHKSIKITFIIYMLICIFSALLLSLFFSSLCQFGQSVIYQKYNNQYNTFSHKYKTELNLLKTEDKKIDGTLYYNTVDITSFFTPFETSIYNIMEFFTLAFYPICFILCVAITSILFYKKQLQKPFEILDNAADNISKNNLDFKIVYNNQNELGRLCLSFEKMRATLQENHIEMWRQMEERKRLNAAFSHDLRTPLTVLKGQSEMLIKYTPQMSTQKIVSIAEMMQRHIVRLESYVNTMNDLQRLEDIEINKASINIDEAVKQMYSTGISICQNKNYQACQTLSKKFTFSDYISEERKEIIVDFSMIMRVYENLLSNAIRFAKENIFVTVKIKNDDLYLIVSDDGNGFTNTELSNATKPFYKSVYEKDNNHFGMGLNICKILCEKHGGSLILKNNDGAIITAIIKQSNTSTTI